MRTRLVLIAVAFVLVVAPRSFAFCGFYVAKGDAKLFNRASQVAIVHDGERTVMTMANDYQGDPKDFAVVVPVPTPIQREQIHVAEKALIDHLDSYTSPRLVEYFDPDPCEVLHFDEGVRMAPPVAGAMKAQDAAARAKSLGVTIEARYTVGEYDILILSAKESDGLETWLRENGYRIPNGAGAVLGSYIKQHMHFFVAKVNLKEQSKLGYQYLRPLQVAYESPKFMLPIRLGTVHAKGPQELFIYMITKNGRVETTNYRTVKLPSDVQVPEFVRADFAPFYKALFSEQVRREEMQTVFLEYAWDMRWCDPCAADPLSREELRSLGVWWNDAPNPEAFVTRLHVRYDREHFPEDLVFQDTGDRQNFQARYVMNHPWTGKADCDQAKQYRRMLADRQKREAENVARLTGWDIGSVRKRMNIASANASSEKEKSWWEKLWQ